MKAVVRSPLALGALVVAITIVALALATQPGPETLETSRSLVEPGSTASTSSRPLLAEDPGLIESDEVPVPDAPPALGLIDPAGPDARALRSPQGPDKDEASTGQTTTDDEPLWDDASARPAPATTTRVRPPSSATDTPTSTTTGVAETNEPSEPAPGVLNRSVPARTTKSPMTRSPAATVPAKTVPAKTVPAKTVPPTSTTVTPTTTAAPTTTTTAAPTTTTAAAPTPVGTKGAAGYIAPTAPTYIPVYDTAWQMLVRSTPAQADNYFAALKANGFTGTWSGIIHHAPATYNLNFAGGGEVGSMQNGELILSDAYVAHVRSILDSAERHGMKVGLVAAWQNLYLPGGGADDGVGTSNAVRGTITTANSRAYGRHIAEKFGNHPAVSMWVFGGDAGTNNTAANKEVWREMARGVRDAGNGLSITYHTPTSEFDQLNYAGEPWLDFISPETGHAQDEATTENELRTVKSTYGLPVWQGEPRYFNINFDWVNAAFRNPGVDEVRADAQAAENAGVSGYVYGDAGRWTWCAGYGDSSPCSAGNVAASFGPGEAAVIEVFSS